MFPAPFPTHIKFGLSIGSSLLIAYPTLKVCLICFCLPLNILLTESLVWAAVCTKILEAQGEKANAQNRVTYALGYCDKSTICNTTTLIIIFIISSESRLIYE
jgi:hypothetical protein